MSELDRVSDPGFYGKLPAYGDFIQKRLPRDFTAPWDDWLQAGIAAAKERLPQEWLTFYLSCPAWTFVLGNGICGEQAVAGVTIPSVDKVGRYFNFTLAALLPAGTSPALFLARHHAWLGDLEDLALTALGDEWDQDRIDQSLNELPTPEVEGLRSPGTLERGDDWMRLAFTGADTATGRLDALLHALVQEGREGSYGLWLQDGSNQVGPQLLCCRHLPATSLFLDMMVSTDAEDPKSEGDDVLDEFLSQ